MHFTSQVGEFKRHYL